MNIIIASDHGGFELKHRLRLFLEQAGHLVHDEGVHTPDSVDYPDIAARAYTTYRKGEHELVILVCGTGIGISISANKLPGVRCALVHDSFTARMAREHNNANFLAFGGRVSYGEPVEQILDSFLRAGFEGGRHQQRVDKIHDLEPSG